MSLYLGRRGCEPGVVHATDHGQNRGVNQALDRDFRSGADISCVRSQPAPSTVAVIDDAQPGQVDRPAQVQHRLEVADAGTLGTGDGEKKATLDVAWPLPVVRLVETGGPRRSFSPAAALPARATCRMAPKAGLKRGLLWPDGAARAARVGGRLLGDHG